MVLLALVTTVSLVLLTHFIYRKWKHYGQNCPPGPVGLPIVGYSMFLKPRTFKALMQLKSRYPDIAQVDFGMNSMVILNSFDTIKEALVTKGDNFSGRQKNFFKETRGMGDGIVGSEGNLWKEHRRFAMRTLRDYGFGKNLSEQIIHTEIQRLLEQLEKERLQGDSCVNIMELLLRSVSNVICTMSMGEQPAYENEETLDAIHEVREFLNLNIFAMPTIMFPKVIEFLGPYMEFIPKVKFIVEKIVNVCKFLQKKIDDHVKSFDISQDSRDYIDSYLHEQQKLNATKAEAHTFTAAQLQREIFELFIAGTDTTSNSLSWALLFLAIYPDIQKRCYAEIECTIGRGRVATMKDKEQMPYVQAVLDETQRYATVVPTGAFHRNFVDDTIHGYHIPSSTLIVPFVYGVHHDPRVWEKPEEFYPEHFLCESLSDAKPVYRSREELIPFLIGKRECLGASLAKMEFFLFFVTILQRYEVKLPELERPRLQATLLGSEGPVHSPGAHKLYFHPRS